MPSRFAEVAHGNDAMKGREGAGWTHVNGGGAPFHQLAAHSQWQSECSCVRTMKHNQADHFGGEIMNASVSDYRLNLFDQEMRGTALPSFVKERTLLEEAKELKQEFSCGNGKIVTSSPQMLRVIEIARRVANTDASVLILGESGVGKDVIAHFIHHESNRFGNPFVKVNCAALPEELLESELFGYDRGAFTGAIQNKAGKFEQANRGTLFLDEIAEMTPHLQAKLLHVLQDGEFSRLGSNCTTKVDVRILAATNRELRQAVLTGELRTDLYFRLTVISLQIPPLRHRPADTLLLADHFREKYCERYASSIRAFPDDVMETFIKHAWPGNVRQLENAVKRYLILDDIMEDEVDIATPVAHSTEALFLKDVGFRAADQAQREIALRVLDQTGGNRKECARRLHISYKAFRNKLAKWNIRRGPMPSERVSGGSGIAPQLPSIRE